MEAFASVVEVVFVDLEIPDVGAIAAAVRHHITRLPAQFRGLGRHSLARPAAVDADDGVGHRHTPTVAQIATRMFHQAN
jgi:hypothetical protein